MTIELPNEAATLSWGSEFAATLTNELVFLRGSLGAGKTTMVRGILRAMGESGVVKSPTYTLIEPYELQGRCVYHFDFYRIDDSEELSFIGVDDLMEEGALKLVEWPERALDRLPEPDIELKLVIAGEGRLLEVVDHRIQ